MTYSADDGTFAFAAVPDEVLVSVSRAESPGDVVARLVVEVPERDRKEIEVVLPKVREAVAIHVTDNRGYPLNRVEVRVALARRGRSAASAGSPSTNTPTQTRSGGKWPETSSRNGPKFLRLSF